MATLKHSWKHSVIDPLDHKLMDKILKIEFKAWTSFATDARMPDMPDMGEHMHGLTFKVDGETMYGDPGQCLINGGEVRRVIELRKMAEPFDVVTEWFCIAVYAFGMWVIEQKLHHCDTTQLNVERDGLDYFNLAPATFVLPD